MIKPTVFIGCSTTHLSTARTIRDYIEGDVHPKVWDEGVFSLANSTLDDLLEAVEKFDFAIFVFAADDLVRIKRAKVARVRDNVLFELGLFMGKIGKQRTFWVVPRGSEAPNIPTDLLGITYASFDPTDVATGPISESLNAACRQILVAMKKLGRRTDRSLYELDEPRILCVASAQFSTPEFEAAHNEIAECFQGASIEVERNVTAQGLWERLSQDKWDLIHLAMLVDARSGDVILDDRTSSNAVSSPLRAKGFVDLIEMTSARLVAIPTCDSLALAGALAPITSVIAGRQAVSIQDAREWAVRFYSLIGMGHLLSKAFDIAQGISDPGLVLIARQDLRVITTTSTPKQIGHQAGI